MEKDTKMNLAETAAARRCSVKKGVLKNFDKFTGKHLCSSFFFNKVTGRTLLKKRLQNRCFPVNFRNFLRTGFFTENLRRLAASAYGTVAYGTVV